MNHPQEPFDPLAPRLVQALRKLPHGEPPADFAGSVVRAAERRAKTGERWLLLAPGAAFVPAALYAVARFGDAWAASLGAMGPMLPDGSGANWLLATGACLALSWVFAQLRPAGLR